MDRNIIIERASRNRKELLASPLVAKAVVAMPNGSLRVLTVYDKSTRCEYYWVHKTNAKNKRAPRRGWSNPASMARDFTTDYKPYIDFTSFVAWYAATNHCTVLSVLVYKKRRLAALSVHTDYETLTHDWNWTEAMNTTNPENFRLMNRKLESKIRGREISPFWRKP